MAKNLEAQRAACKDEEEGGDFATGETEGWGEAEDERLGRGNLLLILETAAEVGEGGDGDAEGVEGREILRNPSQRKTIRAKSSLGLVSKC